MHRASPAVLALFLLIGCTVGEDPEPSSEMSLQVEPAAADGAEINVAPGAALAWRPAVN